ncbi:zinc finger protein 436-like [Planococcus citri]|uniref:zinc finger protein 436-like n=1 Tax=Planococcus citri TaxID=170843 RepID=UPI0031F936AF
MSKRTVNLYVCDDVIQNCEKILEYDIAKFHDCSKLLEKFRSLFVSTNDEYQFLKTCLDRACVDTITSKSEHGDLSKLYEILLTNNFVKKFLQFINKQETLRLKFIDGIIEHKNLEKMLNKANENFTLLKSERNDSVLRNYDLLLKTDFAEELLDQNTKEQEILRLKFVAKVEECERIKKYLDTAYETMMILNSQHDDLIRRFKILCEKNIVKEFLEYAKQRETPRLEITEKTNDCNDLVAREVLITEQLRYKKLKDERDALDYLSEELCRLLQRYQRRAPFDQTRGEFEENRELVRSSAISDFTSSDYSNIANELDNEASFSSETRTDIKNSNLCHDFESNHQVWLVKNDEDELIVVKEEKTDLSFEMNEEFDILTEHASDSFEKTPENKYFEKLDCQNSDDKSSKNILEHDASRDEKPYQCTTCNKRFNKIDYLKRHELMHSSEKLFKCSMCDKCFKDPSNKGRHERTVHGKGPRYCCAHCDENYARKGNLIIHIKSKHLPRQENEYRCTYCHKTFVSKESWKYHHTTHSSNNDRPYRCSICCKGFKDSKTRTKHEKKVHVEEIRFYCALCRKNYRYKYDLTRHMQKDHL